MNDYWSIRSKKYDNLKWTKDKVLLKQLLTFCSLKKSDSVLDAGCGTGTVAKQIVDLVSHVYASDKSQDMLSKIGNHNNIHVLCKDIERDVIFEDFFDKIIARMVFHHIDNLPNAFDNCYKMLSPGGWLIVQEGGVIPEENKEVFDWYEKMIALKEDRQNFTAEDLRCHFMNSGFSHVREKTVVDTTFSVNNWLDNSGQDEKILKQIYDLHVNAPNAVKHYYNMRIVDEEITIDSKVLIIKGQKGT